MRQGRLVRRAQIIEQARVLVSERGMEGLTIKNLARAVGVTEGAIYRHFLSKQEILLGLIDYIEARLGERLLESGSNQETPLETLRNVLTTQLSLAERQQGALSVVMAEVLLNGSQQLRQRMMEVVTHYLSMLEEVLRTAVQQGQVSPDTNVRTGAFFFFGVIQGVNTIRHFATEEPPEGEDETLWEMCQKGFGVESDATPARGVEWARFGRGSAMQLSGSGYE